MAVNVELGGWEINMLTFSTSLPIPVMVMDLPPKICVASGGYYFDKDGR